MQRATFFIIIAPLIFLWSGCQPKSVYEEAPPPKVTVAKPTVESVTIFIEENGETEAVERAVVRARVQGVLEKINFQPNQDVTKGTPLFLIEKREYQVAVDAAEAELTSAEATLKTATAAVGVAQAQIAVADAEIVVTTNDFERLSGLLKDKAISQREWEESRGKKLTAEASLQAAKANLERVKANIDNEKAKVEKAKADLDQAKLNLEWTTVVSPIDGRVTRSAVKEGNLVESGTEMVTIVRSNPVWANFNISEQFLLAMERKAERRGDKARDPSKIKAFLQRNGDDGYPFEGRLDHWDPEVDQATATLGVRAVFENNLPDKDLLPGLFVRVRVPIGTQENALLIPERALIRDQTGTFVFVVDNKNKVQRKLVALGTKQGEKIVITSGITANDTIIVDGIQRARPGLEVDPSTE